MPPVHTARPVRVGRTDHGFVVHYLQILAAMTIGMVVLGPLTMLIDAGVVAEALLMATTMTVCMTAWMTWRRHDWPAIAEMAAAMHAAFAVLPGLLARGAVPGRAHARRARPDAPSRSASRASPRGASPWLT